MELQLLWSHDASEYGMVLVRLCMVVNVNEMQFFVCVAEIGTIDIVLFFRRFQGQCCPRGKKLYVFYRPGEAFLQAIKEERNMMFFLISDELVWGSKE